MEQSFGKVKRLCMGCDNGRGYSLIEKFFYIYFVQNSLTINIYIATQ